MTVELQDASDLSLSLAGEMHRLSSDRPSPLRIVSESSQLCATPGSPILRPRENGDRGTGTSVFCPLSQSFLCLHLHQFLREEPPAPMAQASLRPWRELRDIAMCTVSSFPVILCLSFCPSFIPLLYRVPLCLQDNVLSILYP